MFWCVIRVLGGQGEFRQVLFAGGKFLRLPQVGEGLSISFGVAQYFAEPGVIVGAVHGGVNVIRGCGLVRRPG